MAVVHLHRPTKFNRVSMSAANLVCSKYPGDETIHKLTWGIISKSPNKAFKFLELETAIELLLNRLNLNGYQT